MMSLETCRGCGDTTGFRHAGRAPGFSVSVGERVFVQPDYLMVQCANCGIYSKTPTWSAEDELDYYQCVEATKWDAPELFPTEREVLRILRESLSGGSVLDFGCGTGRLLGRLGPAFQRYGLELNAGAAQVARAKGINVLSEQDLILSRQKFDAIVLCDVIEHIRYPMNLLSLLDRHIVSGGLLVLVSGNAAAKACQRDVAGFWYMRAIEHVLMVSPEFCRYIATKLGYTQEIWREMCHYDMPIFKRLRQHVQDYAYWGFRLKDWRAIVLRWMPVLRRARHWTVPPTFACTRDHVVVGYRKIGDER